MVAANPQQVGPMTCVHCGNDSMTMSYTLRCMPETRDPSTVELHLCTDCLRRLCAEEDIELVEEAQFITAD